MSPRPAPADAPERARLAGGELARKKALDSNVSNVYNVAMSIDCSVREAADHLGLTVFAMKQRIARAKRHAKGGYQFVDLGAGVKASRHEFDRSWIVSIPEGVIKARKKGPPKAKGKAKKGRKA